MKKHRNQLFWLKTENYTLLKIFSIKIEAKKSTLLFKASQNVSTFNFFKGFELAFINSKFQESNIIN